MQISKKVIGVFNNTEALKAEMEGIKEENKTLKTRLIQAEQTNADISLVQQELLEVLIEMEVI
jgi:S-adenosylmethionine:tRNA-ribosyltransferase-isomerase (queuine synthetase)